MSTRECTYKYLSAGTAVRAAAPLDCDTRARGIFFFLSPPCLESTLQRVYNEEKKVFFVALRPVPHKFVFTPQPRRNFVLRKFAAYLWKIISVLRLKLLTSLASGISPSRCIAMPLLFCINASPARSFYRRSVASVTVARSSLS